MFFLFYATGSRLGKLYYVVYMDFYRLEAIVEASYASTLDQNGVKVDGTEYLVQLVG